MRRGQCLHAIACHINAAVTGSLHASGEASDQKDESIQQRSEGISNRHILSGWRHLKLQAVLHGTHNVRKKLCPVCKRAQVLSRQY